MNKDSEKIFENYLAAGMIPMDKLEEEEAPQAGTPASQNAAANPDVNPANTRRVQDPTSVQRMNDAGAADQSSAAADPGSMLAGIIAEDPNSIAELAGLAEVQQWIQSKSQATQPAAPVPAAPAQAAPAPAPAQ